VIVVDGNWARIGDVTVVADDGLTALIVDGRLMGMAALTPGQADDLADLLRIKAQEARKQKAGTRIAAAVRPLVEQADAAEVGVQ
jgi:hypothetical protein